MSDLVLVTASDRLEKRLREFVAGGLTIASVWGARTRVVRVDTGEDIARAIERVPDGELERVAFAMHGGWSWLLASRRGIRDDEQRPPAQLSTAYLAGLLARKAAPGLLVSLAACWTGFGRRPSAPEVAVGGWLLGGLHYGPGGSECLAGRLWRALAPHVPGLVVLAHSTRGHTTRNPCLRAWGPGYGLGAGLLDYYFGQGAHGRRADRAAWLAACRRADAEERQGAELLLAGVTPGWLSRRGAR